MLYYIMLYYNGLKSSDSGHEASRSALQLLPQRLSRLSTMPQGLPKPLKRDLGDFLKSCRTPEMKARGVEGP